MKSKKVFSMLLVASMGFSVMLGCVDAKETGAQVAETKSAIPSIMLDASDITIEHGYLDSIKAIDYKEVMSNPEAYSYKEVAQAGYENLDANNIDLENKDIISELNNILIYGSTPMCCTEEEYNALVGKLASTLDEGQNAFECYYPIAVARHIGECPEKHDINEFNRITCPVIAKSWDECKPINIEDELNIEFAEDAAYLRIKKALSSNSTLTIEDYLKELENLAILSLEPTDFHDDETWYMLFGNLDATLSEDESLYDTYISLAIKVHNMLYPDNIIALPKDIFLERT